MAEPAEYRRIFQKVDTYDGWMANPLILGNGEQAFVRGGGVILNFRMGDGTKRFSELPNVIQYDQAAYVAPNGNTLPVPASSIGYSILTSGTYNGNLVVPIGNLGIADYSGGSWRVRTMDLPKNPLSTYMETLVLLDNNSLPGEGSTAILANNTTSNLPNASGSRNVDVRYYCKDNECLINYKGCCSVSGNTASSTALLYVDKDDNIVVLQPVITGVSPASSDLQFTLPKGAKYVSATFLSKNTFPGTLSVMFNKKTDYAQYNLDSGLFNLLVTNSKLTDNNGVLSLPSNANYKRSRYASVNEGDVILVDGVSLGDGVVLVGTVGNQNIDSSSVVLVGSGVYRNYVVTIPRGINFVILSGVTNLSSIYPLPKLRRVESIKGNIKYRLPEPIANWKFTEDQAPYLDTNGRNALELGNSNTIEKISLNQDGGGLRFTGNQYLKIDNDKLGELNIGRSGDCVTVVAWIRKRSIYPDQNSFIAGIWREDDNNPSRMFGLFDNLPGYGSDNKVIGHVSRFGGASPNIIYSRDMSNSADSIIYDRIEMCAISYDGQKMTSYKNGIASYSLDFTERNDAPIGEGKKYNKNPYNFDLGLNKDSISEFTVGAVLITSGMSNFFRGDLGELMVFDKSLSSDEIMQLNLSRRVNNEVFKITFGKNNVATFNADVDIRRIGWDQYYSNRAVNAAYSSISQDVAPLSFRTIKTAGYGKSFAYIDGSNNSAFPILFFNRLINPFSISNANKISFALNNAGSFKCKPALKIKGKGWVVSSQDFVHPGNGSPATVATEVAYSLDVLANPWLRYDIKENEVMAVRSESYSFKGSEQIESFGFYVYDNTLSGTFRITDITFGL